MIKRIELIMQSQNLTASQFADRIGIQRSGLSHILSGRNNPSLDFVLKVLKSFPELEPVWLLQGKGPMYANMSGALPKEESLALEKNQALEPGQEVVASSLLELPFDESSVSESGSAGEQSAVASSFVANVPDVSSDSLPPGLPISNFCNEGGKGETGRRQMSAAEGGADVRDASEPERKDFPRKQASATRLQRIVFFYEDGTYEAYTPR